MTKFATSFIASIDGTSSEVSLKELCGGARIYYIYSDVFGTQLSQIDPTANLSVLDIRTAIRNSTGPRPSLFVPELAFDLLVKPQIRLLDPPSQRCVELVYEELMKICHTCGGHELSRYPRLQSKIIEVVSDLLRERLGPTSKYVESLIAIQRAYINTKHPNFLGAAAAMSSILAGRQEKEKKARDAQRKLERLEVKKAVLNGENADGKSFPVETAATVAATVTATTTANIQPHHHHHNHHHAQHGSDSRSRAASNASEASNGVVNGGGGGGGGRDTHSLMSFFFSKENTSHVNSTGNGGNNDNDDDDDGVESGVARIASSHSRLDLGSSEQGSTHSQQSQSQPPPPVRQHQHSNRQSDDLTREFEQMSMSNSTQAAKSSNSSISGSGFSATNNGLLGTMGSINGEEGGVLSEREQLETELIRRLISSYFSIVRETIQDQVPKAVMHLLVNYSKESIQNRLVSELYKEVMFDELLQEDSAIAQERQKCEKMLRTYTEAARIINEVV